MTVTPYGVHPLAGKPEYAHRASPEGVCEHICTEKEFHIQMDRFLNVQEEGFSFVS